jgi:hypothetical protein
MHFKQFAVYITTTLEVLLLYILMDKFLFVGNFYRYLTILLLSLFF